MKPGYKGKMDTSRDVMGKKLRPCLPKGEDPVGPVGTPSRPLPSVWFPFCFAQLQFCLCNSPPLSSAQPEVEGGRAGQQRESRQGR